jgi:sugar phosphate isomerase/epimerase
MILGISSYTYGWSIAATETEPMDEQDLIEQVQAFGLHCLQIGDNLPVHLFNDDRLANLKKETSSKKIRVEIGARGLTDENIERYIELAHYLNAPLLRFVIDGPRFEPDCEYVIGVMKNIIPELKAKGITLGIENHDRLKAKKLAHIMEAAGDERIGICLDCVNSIGAGEGLEYVSDILTPYTINLHIKDFVIKRLPHLMGFTVIGSPAGQGITDLDLLMEKISKYNRCQSAILEQWVVPENDMKETIVKERLWAQASIDFLKNTKYFDTKQI